MTEMRKKHGLNFNSGSHHGEESSIKKVQLEQNIALGVCVGGGYYEMKPRVSPKFKL